MHIHILNENIVLKNKKKKKKKKDKNLLEKLQKGTTKLVIDLQIMSFALNWKN